MNNQATSILSSVTNAALVFDEYLEFKNIVESDEYLVISKLAKLPISFTLNGVKFYVLQYSHEKFTFDCNLSILAIYPDFSVSSVIVLYDLIRGYRTSGDVGLVGYIAGNLSNIK